MISIIIPVYNRVEALKRALASVASQTYKDVEVIVVDDGSIENFQFSIFNFQKKMNIKFIKQEHAGAPAARNRGLAEAKGEYVIFWDADIIGDSQMLEKMLGVLERNPSASYSYSNFQFSIFNFKTILNFLIFKKKISSGVYNFDRLKKCNYIHSTSLIRRHDVIKWDESIKRFQDWDLWLAMSEMGKTGVWVDEYLFTVLGGGTISKWLPRIAYRFPFCLLPGIKKQVNEYLSAKKVIVDKHQLTSGG